MAAPDTAAEHDLEQLRRFYAVERLPGQTLFDIWERGAAFGDSVTPSTYSDAYRTWMLAKLERCLFQACGNRVLSLGCGNAVIEAALRRRRWSVLAIDALPRAVELARSKGVDAVVANVMAWDGRDDGFDLVYADGLLGHLYRSAAGLRPALRRVRRWLGSDRARLVACNDSPAGGVDVTPAAGVGGFYWLSAGYIAAELGDSGYRVTGVEEFVYRRPLSGPRRRAIVTACQD